MKNVVFWTGIKNNSPDMVEKYGGYEWMDISKKSWEYWCKKNDCIFYHYDTPHQSDLKEFRVTWQRWFDVFDELEKNNIDYDKILLIDACSIVKWNCPNFFELTDDRLTAWLDKDNWGWIHQSVVGYKDFFKSHNHNLSSREIVNDYINAGAVIINKKHKEFFKSLKEFYYDNKDKLISLQDKEVKKGTDQTPFNYWLKINNVEVNTSLPFMYNLTHMHRKSMLQYNWQLGDDKIPYFIKWGYVWKYNGIPKNERTSLMKQTWDLVGHFYRDNSTIDEMLDGIPDKKDFNKTTSIQFKKDLFNYFLNNVDTKDKKLKVLELGTNHGYTTRILAFLFDKVITFDKFDVNVHQAKMINYDFSNIDYHKVDVYGEKWPDVDFDVVFIDCMHTYEAVVSDINNVLNRTIGKQVYFIFDDYGLNWGPNSGQVKQAIDEFINKDYIKIVKEIGHPKGTSIGSKEILGDVEGLICIKTRI
tara:strand:- start:3393 stop:4811 length:1419 start_codon:yes stop_codon:yes gene_type:complete